MKNKYQAKFIGKTYDYEGRPNLHYKYKGREYIITDYGWNQPEGGSLYQQHQEEQRRIDEMLSRPAIDPNNKGTFDFDKIWEMMDWD